MIDIPKKHRHIHGGLLCIVIILIFLLYRVNIESTLSSTSFKNDVGQAKVTVKNAWQKYVGDTLQYIWFQIIHPTDKSITVTPPAIDDKAIEQKVQPVKVRTYFGNTSEETVQQITDPNKKY